MYPIPMPNSDANLFRTIFICQYEIQQLIRNEEIGIYLAVDCRRRDSRLSSIIS